MLHRSWLAGLSLCSVLLGSGPLQAQSATPGTPINEATVSSAIQTLFSLAGQLYPSVFAGGSDWFLYEGYTYKFFPSAGIYAGVKDGNVFLLGGAYGSSLKSSGTVTDITGALQSAVKSKTDFTNAYPIKTLNDLASLFRELTVSTFTKSNLVNISVTSSIKLEVLGAEAIGNANTTKFKVTVDGSNLSKPSVAEMWADASGVIHKLVLNGFEYAANIRQSIGDGLVSGMLLGLAGPETPYVKAAIANELKNPALSQKLKSKTLNGASYSTLEISVKDASGTTSVVTDITDFGNFTMATRFDSTIAGTFGSVNRMEVTSAVLR